MLTLVLVVVVSQSPVIQRFSSGRATVEDLWALQGTEAFSKKDLAALEKTASVASRKSTCEKQPRDCQYEISECMSRFAFVLSVVEGRGQSTPRFLAWAEEALRGDDPRALAPARRMLARAKHPGIEAEALKLLRRNDYSCIGEGARLLADVPQLSDEARVAVTNAFHSEDALSIGALVATRDEPWAQALALDAIRSGDGHLRMGVIRALRKTASPELKSAVNFVASCDPSQRLQEEARQHLKSVGVAVTPVKCPTPVWKLENGVVTDGRARVKLSATSTVSACDGGLGAFSGHCIGARHDGEFGGALGFVRRDGGLDVVAEGGFLHPAALVKQGSETLVISTLEHLGGSGGFGRLISEGDGGVRYEATMRFIGAPSSWAATNERLFIAFPSHAMTSPCLSDDAKLAVMVYERDGGFSIADSESSNCLWKK